MGERHNSSSQGLSQQPCGSPDDPALGATAALAGQWVRYDGKGRPHPNGTPLEIEQRDGKRRIGKHWSEITWSLSTSFPSEDVMFYRVVSDGTLGRQDEVVPQPRDEPPSPVTAEQVAQIIDPNAFVQWEAMRRYCIGQGDSDMEARDTADHFHAKSVSEATALATQILALTTPKVAVTEAMDAALKYAADVRWQELSQGAPFTVIDRHMLHTLYTKATAALATAPKGEGA